MSNRTISFPRDFSIGILSVRPLGSREDWSIFANAMGDVVVPSHKEARLEVSTAVVFDPRVLSTLEPDILSVLEWVGSRKVTNEAVANLRHLTGLKGLALWETNIGDEALRRHLRHLSNLQWLDIGDTRITDDAVAHLSKLSLLKELSLLNDRITDKGLTHIHNLTHLEHLDLMNTAVTDEGADKICKMKALKTLRIFNTGITTNGYEKLKRALPACRISYLHPHHA